MRRFVFLRERLHEANVFSFGVGSSVNRALIEGLARAGAGEPFIVTHPSQGSAQVKAFVNYVQSPVLTSVETSFHGLDAYDVEPSRVPDVLAQRPVVFLGKYRVADRTLVLQGWQGEGAFKNDAEFWRRRGEGGASIVAGVVGQAAHGDAAG